MKKRMRKAVAIAATAAMVGSLPAGAVTAQAADERTAVKRDFIRQIYTITHTQSVRLTLQATSRFY